MPRPPMIGPLEWPGSDQMTEWERFEHVLKAVLAVPKSAIDEDMRRDKG